MKKSEAIAWFGSQNKLAKFLGVYQSNVSTWKEIPAHHQKTIEEHTKGELKAEDQDKKERYMCYIEVKYLNMLHELSKSLEIPVVAVLRRAIALYHSKNL